MRKLFLIEVLSAVLLTGCHLVSGKKCCAVADGWQSLFDGTLNGWKASEREGTFTVRDGIIVVKGERSHLYYVGPIENANFENFEFKADVMTEPGSNSGMYFHTEYQETGWPDKGYEVQVNNTHKDVKKTGGLYAVEDVFESPAKDHEWFTQHIIVRGKRIIIKVNGKTTVDWTEPEGFKHERFPGRKLSSGTFALQGHDPKSVVYFKNIMVRPLPSKPKEKIKVVVVTGGHGFEREPFLWLFKGHGDIEYVEAQQKDHSEIFEDISKWDYDVIVLYNMTQNISPKRQKNFVGLLKRGVGVVALHHNMGSFQQWDEYRKIIGAKYYLKPVEQAGKMRQASTYKHDVDIAVQIKDAAHPITRGVSDFVIRDETYKNCGFERDNHVLLSTDHPTSDRSLGWVRKYAKARVCGIQLGHGREAYANPNYRRLVAGAIRWCAGRLK